MAQWHTDEIIRRTDDEVANKGVPVDVLFCGHIGRMKEIGLAANALLDDDFEFVGALIDGATMRATYRKLTGPFIP